MTDKDAERLAGYTAESVKQLARFANSIIDKRDETIARLTQERDEAQTEVARLKELLQRASDKLCHYATDDPQPDTLKIINDCDRALARGHYLCSPTATGEPTPDDVESRAVLIDSLNNSGIPQVAKFTPDAERAREIVYSLEWLCEAIDVDERENLKVHLTAALTAARREERELHALNEAVIEAARKIERALYEDTDAADHPCCGWGPLWIELRGALAARDAATGERPR
jgi:hypothetical protein